MLGGIVWAVVFAGILLTGATEATVLYVRLQAQHLASAQVNDVMRSAQAQLLSSIRAQIQAGRGPAGVAAPSYAPISLCAGQSSQSCSTVAGASFAVSGSSNTQAPADAGGSGYGHILPVLGAPIDGSGGGSGGGVVGSTGIVAVNANQTLGEGRVSFDVTATVTRGTTVLATRTVPINIETFANAPYAVIVGAVAGNGAAQGSTIGDIAGCDPANPTGCTANATASVDDTRAHVNPQCTQDPTECSQATSNGYAPHDSFHDVTWYSNDANPAGLPH